MSPGACAENASSIAVNRVRLPASALPGVFADAPCFTALPPTQKDWQLHPIAPAENVADVSMYPRGSDRGD